MSNLVCEDVNRSEASGGIRPAQHVSGPKLGDHARMGWQTNSTDRCQSHRDSITTTAFFRVEIQPESSVWIRRY